MISPPAMIHHHEEWSKMALVSRCEQPLRLMEVKCDSGKNRVMPMNPGSRENGPILTNRNQRRRVVTETEWKSGRRLVM
jgi:hypothetical protein